MSWLQALSPVSRMLEKLPAHSLGNLGVDHMNELKQFSKVIPYFCGRSFKWTQVIYPQMHTDFFHKITFCHCLTSFTVAVYSHWLFCNHIVPAKVATRIQILHDWEVVGASLTGLSPTIVKGWPRLSVAELGTCSAGSLGLPGQRILAGPTMGNCTRGRGWAVQDPGRMR